jgi:hypothetical protein
MKKINDECNVYCLFLDLILMIEVIYGRKYEKVDVIFLD